MAENSWYLIEHIQGGEERRKCKLDQSGLIQYKDGCGGDNLLNIYHCKQSIKLWLSSANFPHTHSSVDSVDRIETKMEKESNQWCQLMGDLDLYHRYVNR